MKIYMKKRAIRLAAVASLVGLSIVCSPIARADDPSETPAAPDFRGGLEINTIAPLAQSSGRLLFLGVDGTLLAGHGGEDNDTVYNLGGYLGYRVMTHAGIIGAWAGIDTHEGRFGNAFERAIGGVEYFGSRFIARFGGFMPFDDKSDEWTYTNTNLSPQQILRITTSTLEEVAPSGIDGEVGVRFPIAHSGGIVPELRLFVGGYSYFDVAGGDDEAGWRTRSELDLYPFSNAGDMRVTLMGQLTSDDVMGDQGRAGIRLTFPLGNSAAGTPELATGGSLKDNPAPQSTSGGNLFDPVWRNRDPASGLNVKNSTTSAIDLNPAPAASDRRLKHGIQMLATTKDGIRIYAFRYLPEIDPTQRVYVGVMAQDLVNSNPEALVVMDNGYYAVRYDMLGLRMASFADWKSRGMAAIFAGQSRGVMHVNYPQH